MKKIATALLCVMAACCFTSCEKDVENIDLTKCDNTTKKCWHYTVSYSGYDADTYMWGTELEVATILKTAQKTASVAGYTAKVTYKAAKYDTMDACAQAAVDNATK